MSSLLLEQYKKLKYFHPLLLQGEIKGKQESYCREKDSFFSLVLSLWPNEWVGFDIS